MTATNSKEDEGTRLRRENKEKLSIATEPDELVRNRELAREHGVTSNRVTLVHAVSARLRLMLAQARIGLDADAKGKGRKESEMKRLPNGFINDPPTWLLEHSAEGWTLRGWPSSHPALPTNKPISSWPTTILYSLLSMLLAGTILLVLPSPTQPDRETIVRAPRHVEPPSKKRRSGSVGAGSTWGSEYGGSDGEADLDAEEREVLGMLEPTRADAFDMLAASPLPSGTNASGTAPPASPPDGADGTTLAASASPKRSTGKLARTSLKAGMKTKPARTSVGPRVLAAEDPSDGTSSSASISADESSPEPSAATTSGKKHNRSTSTATAGGGEPDAKKHRRSRSGIDPEERARLLEQKEAEKAARKAQREADREAKKEAKEAERKARIEQRILKEAKREADELARMEREMRGVEDVKDTNSKRRLSVAPSEGDPEARESKRRKVK